MNNIHERENVISTNGIRKGIMNKNMKMKNTEYKMKKENMHTLLGKLKHNMKIL